MSTQEEKLDHLLDEMFQMEHDLIHKLSTIIDAKWDAPTLKIELEGLNKQYWEIRYEIDALEEKQKNALKEKQKKDGSQNE